MLNSLLENPNAQGLVLAPTRELAQQISDVSIKLLLIVPGLYLLFPV
jgi:superfamily II DNA/RNA helicase